VSNQASNRDC